MRSKGHRTIVDISADQAGLDFEHSDYLAEFTLPDYQRRLLLPRAYALLTDLAIVFGIYLVFVVATFSEMPETAVLDRQALSVYGVGYLVLVVVYFALSMLSASQTTGMHIHRLVAVTGRGDRLNPTEALQRTLGYVVSIVPLFMGFLWAVIDPEHLTWTDKVSGTFVKRV
jgi:uncharacterized RDD family membrane protein YckC